MGTISVLESNEYTRKLYKTLNTDYGSLSQSREIKRDYYKVNKSKKPIKVMKLNILTLEICAEK